MSADPTSFQQSPEVLEAVRSAEIGVLRHSYDVTDSNVPALELVYDTERGKLDLSLKEAFLHPLSVGRLVRKDNGDETDEREGYLHDVPEHGGVERVPLEEFDFSSLSEVNCDEESIATLGILSHYKARNGDPEQGDTYEEYGDSVLIIPRALKKKRWNLFHNSYVRPYPRHIMRDYPKRARKAAEWDELILKIERKDGQTLYDPALVDEIQELENDTVVDLHKARAEILRAAA